MKIHIRKALPENAREYALCHIACWQTAYKGIITDEYLENMTVEQITENNRQILSKSSNFLCYYVEQDEKMIGRLVINKSRDADKADAGEIAAMYLLDTFWDKGFGKELMDFSLAKLKGMGHNEVILWVLAANSRARRFYERCGFVFDGTEKEICVDIPLIEMRYIRKL